MKNLNLSYIIFGVLALTIIIMVTCRGNEPEEKVEVLSFPNPEEVKEEVKEKVEEIKEEITTTIEEKVEEIETRLEEVLPILDIPSLKEEKIEEAPVEPVVPAEQPTDSIKVETDAS